MFLWTLKCQCESKWNNFRWTALSTSDSILSRVSCRNAADIFNKKEIFRIKQGQIHKRSWRALEADVLLFVKNWLLFNTIFNEYNTFDLSIERPFFQISGPNLDKYVLRGQPIRTLPYCCSLYCLIKSGGSGMFFKLVVYKNFAIFTGI